MVSGSMGRITARNAKLKEARYTAGVRSATAIEIKLGRKSMPFVIDVLRYEFGELPAADLPRIAADALEEGLDSRSLRMLASQFMAVDQPSITLDLYRRALAELGVEVPKPREIALQLIEHTLEDVVASRLDAHEGAKRVIVDLYSETVPDDWVSRYAGDAIGIERLYGLADTLDDLRESLHQWRPERSNDDLEVELMQEIRAEAERLLRDRPWRNAA
jgi:hypothetical protein